MRCLNEVYLELLSVEWCDTFNHDPYFVLDIVLLDIQSVMLSKLYFELVLPVFRLPFKISH